LCIIIIFKLPRETYLPRINNNKNNNNNTRATLSNLSQVTGGIHFWNIIPTISCIICSQITENEWNTSILGHWFQKISENCSLNVLHWRQKRIILKFCRPDRRRLRLSGRYIRGRSCTRQRRSSRSGQFGVTVTSHQNCAASVTHGRVYRDEETAQIGESCRTSRLQQRTAGNVTQKWNVAKLQLTHSPFNF